MPSINDGGSTRSVVHTPDKVTFDQFDFFDNSISLQLNGQLKNHLDSIFSGFQKLISGSEK